MSQQTEARFASGECPVCHGTGWETYKATVFNYGEPEELWFAKRCTKCTGARRLEDKTGVPDEYHDADFSKFDFTAYVKDMSKLKQLCTSVIQDFKQWDNYGKGLYLWSKTPGSGKTFLSCCLAKSLTMKYDIKMRFIAAPDYINAVGNSYKRERGQEDESEVYRTCKILVLDDIGAQIDNDWQKQEIFRLVNKRMEDGNITIYTSNLSPQNLNVDERTKDRIVKSSVVLQMPEESIRRKKAESEQNAFLSKIFS